MEWFTEFLNLIVLLLLITAHLCTLSGTDTVCDKIKKLNQRIDFWLLVNLVLGLGRLKTLKMSPRSSKERPHKLAIGVLGIMLEMAIFLHYGGFSGLQNRYNFFRAICRSFGNFYLISDGKSEVFGLAYLVASCSWAVQYMHGIYRMFWGCFQFFFCIV